MKGEREERERRGEYDESALPDRDQKHPELTPDEDEDQRGGTGKGAIGHTDPPEPTDADPEYQPDPDLGDDWRGWIAETGREHRPRREDVYPYLLIRAMSPGDRGQRPLWPPVPCWESPDLLLIDSSWTGAFASSQLVASPTAGRTYRVFVRVWNLGLLQAIGIHVRAWFVNPGFFGPGGASNPYYTPTLIGGAMVNLDDRTRPGCVSLVELDQPWTVPTSAVGHGCLVASASCPLDQWSGSMAVNDDRHIGQRNLSVLAPTAVLKGLIQHLGGLVPEGGLLELTHGGSTAGPMLTGVTGGLIRLTVGEETQTFKVLASDHRRVPFGVDIGGAQHLLAAFEVDRRSFVVDSGRLAALAKDVGALERTDTLDRDLGVEADRRRRTSAHPFATAGGLRRVVDAVGLEQVADVSLVSEAGLGDALAEGLGHLLDVDDLTGGTVGRRLGGKPGSSHPLRLACSDADDQLVGGYTIVAVTG